ncbi:hypothetical protein CH252_07105 [Rhodococcus sp. 06-1477-1B]|nr:hypothetical protein CH252_07105 [Rhodococcus sp. 06-1477-1B]
MNRFVVGAAVGALIVSTSVVSATAETIDTGSANDVADIVSAVVPDGALPIDAAISGDVVTAQTGGTEASIPLSGGEPIQVQVAVDGQPLVAQIELPEGASGTRGTLADDGTVVYGSASEGAVAVQTLDEGQTRIQTVIPDSAATHEFGYGMEGFHATIDDGGNAAFVTNATEGALVPVEPAWAVDANGASVQTYYEVRGDKLFQVVVPTADTAYPVVADPTWGWRNAAWGVTLSRSETARIKDYAAASAFCAALVKNQRLTIACGVWSGYLQVQAATANNLRPKGCLHIVAVPLPGAISHTYC